MKGRRPKPTALKILHGNPGHKPLNDREAMPIAVAPKCPAHLDTAARKEWRRMAKRLAVLGLLTEIDGDALAAYCDVHSQWCRAKKELASQELVLTGEGNSYLNPLANLVHKWAAQIRSYLIEFGMTPSSRSKVRVEKPLAPGRRGTFARERA